MINPESKEDAKNPDWGMPRDGCDRSQMQVAENTRCVRRLLVESQTGGLGEFVHIVDHETLAVIGLENSSIPGVEASVSRLLWQPGQATMQDLTSIPIFEQSRRSKLITERATNEIDNAYFAWHGFLGSGLSVHPQSLDLLAQANSPKVAVTSVTYAGGEGTITPYDFANQDTDKYTFDSGLLQLWEAILSRGKRLGLSEAEWKLKIKGVVGHSYGGELAYRFMLKYGHECGDGKAKFGLVAPLIMGAKMPKKRWPSWLADCKDKEILEQHVYVLNDPLFSTLVRIVAVVPEGRMRREGLKLAREKRITPAILRHYIGSLGLGAEEILKVHLDSLEDPLYLARWVRLLDNAPMIASSNTTSMVHKRRFALLIGGQKEKKRGDTTLNSAHMKVFEAALASKPEMTVVDSDSPHYPLEGALHDLNKWLLGE